jgi:hypothetical protein
MSPSPLANGHVSNDAVEASWKRKNAHDGLAGGGSHGSSAFFGFHANRRRSLRPTTAPSCWLLEPSLAAGRERPVDHEGCYGDGPLLRHVSGLLNE